MRKLSCVLHILVVVIIIFGLEACTEIPGQTDTSPTPTEVLVIPLNQPGQVNADVVPLRRGPGVEYEQAGTLSRNRSITVVGQSGDGKWYKVELPDYSGDQPSFWVAADFVTLIFSTETVTMTVVVSTASLTLLETTTAQVLSPTVSATLQFPTSSCAVPAGWVQYIVQSGDTLSRLAVRTNTTVDRIMQANCLSGTQLATGSRLYLPFVPPTNTPLIIQTPMPTTSGSPIAISTPTITNTAASIQTPTPTTTGTAFVVHSPTPTATACPTPRPIHTITSTSTVVVSPAAPPPGTAMP
jgi:LysM repeat protein